MTQHAGRIPFLITIDTEPDNMWADRQGRAACQNARFLPRFQELCSSYGLVPTYLTEYRMALDPAYREFALHHQAEGACEVGMHLHAWDSPPQHNLTADDHRHHPYLIEFPDRVLREKVRVLSSELAEIFGRPMRSHRAGRWAFDGRYARALLDNGFLVDCSVTPYVSWRTARGAPAGGGGSDYRRYPRRPYFLDPADISQLGGGGLLEVPMTIRPRMETGWEGAQRLHDLMAARVGRESLPARALARWVRPLWLRPNGRNLREMIDLCRRVMTEPGTHLEFMLHSSEFMPGGSPTFPDAKSIERLYADMEALFAEVAVAVEGMALTEFQRRWLTDGVGRGATSPGGGGTGADKPPDPA